MQQRGWVFDFDVDPHAYPYSSCSDDRYDLGQLYSFDQRYLEFAWSCESGSGDDRSDSQLVSG